MKISFSFANSPRVILSKVFGAKNPPKPDHWDFSEVLAMTIRGLPDYFPNLHQA
jgi:hypothetical protein